LGGAGEADREDGGREGEVRRGAAGSGGGLSPEAPPSPLWEKEDSQDACYRPTSLSAKYPIVLR
jgi:hypothetical protein